MISDPQRPRHRPGPRFLARGAAVVALAWAAVTASATVAPAAHAEVERSASEVAAELVLASHPTTRAAIEARPELRAALEFIVQGPRIDRDVLARALASGHIAPHVERALPALRATRDMPGVERVLRRMTQTADEHFARGPVFELEVGAALGARVAELSAMVGEHEVDALLVDGTVVEAKAFPPDDPALTRRMVEKAVQQLLRRGEHGERLMLFVNRPLSREDLELVRASLGDRVEVRSAVATGPGAHPRTGERPSRAAASAWRTRFPRAVPGPRATTSRPGTPPRGALGSPLRALGAREVAGPGPAVRGAARRLARPGTTPGAAATRRVGSAGRASASLLGAAGSAHLPRP